MITAAEASQLVLESKTNVDLYIRQIEPNVADLAKSGSRIYTCYVTGLWNAFDIWEANSQNFTPIQKAVVAKLKSLGYVVVLGTDGAAYVPRGLQDDDGNGPEKINVCLIIKW